MGNAIAVARACRASLAGLAFVILSASLAEAQGAYGPRTTIGANYQQTSQVASENGIDPAPCSNTLRCYVLFQMAPQQKPLIIEHVSCGALIGELRYGMLETRKGQTLLLTQSHLVPIPTGHLWALNSPVMHLLKPGERAVLRLFHGGTVSYLNPPICTIAGRLLPP